MIHYTADWHIGHKNIVRGVSNWDSGYRDFDTVKAHDTTIISTVNKYVKQEDTLFILGDTTFKSRDVLEEILTEVYCEDIHYIVGNHDNAVYKHLKVGLENMDKDRYPNTARKVKSVGFYAETKTYDSKTMLVLCHYPIASWNRMYKGSYQLHGHSHASYPAVGKQLDVGIDQAFNMFGEYRPFNTQEIHDYMRKREIAIVDHHDENTD